MEIAVAASRVDAVREVIVPNDYNDQHTEAGRFSVQNKYGYKKALIMARDDDADRWPLVTPASLRRILNAHKVDFIDLPDFHLSQVKPKHDGRLILTQTEREDLAACLVQAAKAGRPFNRRDRVNAVLDILGWRKQHQMGGGRAYVKLSKAAKTALKKRTVTRSFWRKFYKDYPILRIKDVQETSSQRAKMCSRVVAQQHIDDIRKCLIKLGIYDEVNDCIVPGKEGNIAWLDECGFFFHFNSKRGSSRRVTGIKGMKAKVGIAENRGTFTVDAALGGDGYMYHPHLIFQQCSVSSDMLPPSTKDLKWMYLTNNEFGVQTGASFFPRLQTLEDEMRDRGITGPICFCTDGHASRFTIPLLTWMAEKDADELPLRCLYITPPNSTGTLCWLDQLFQHLHRHYADCIHELKAVSDMDKKISKWEAVSAIVHLWRTWATPASILRAKRVCGLDEKGRWSIDTIPGANFMLSDKWANDKALFLKAVEEEAPSWRHLSSSPMGSPAEGRPMKRLPCDGESYPHCTIQQSLPCSLLKYVLEYIN